MRTSLPEKHPVSQKKTSKDVYAGSPAVLDDSYDYDFNGNVASISDGLAGANGNRTMAYDGLDRLTSTTSPMFNGTISYTYDVLDNIETLVAPLIPAKGGMPAIPARNLRYCYDANTNRLAFVRTGATNCSSGSATDAFQFDVQGNLKNKNGQGYNFSQDNRLRDVSGKEYHRYDAYGLRVSSWSPALGNLLSIYSKSGQLMLQSDPRTSKNIAYVYLAGSLVMFREQPLAGGTPTLKFQHTDALGTPVAVTALDRSVVERSEREPYGRLLNRPIHDGPGFTGHVEDAATGLTYMQQRYYDPQVGMFLSVDPVTATSVGGNFNRYWYANNNPYRFTDPDGRQPRRGEMNLCGTPGLCGTSDGAAISASMGRGGGAEESEGASSTMPTAVQNAINSAGDQIRKTEDAEQIAAWEKTTWTWDPLNQAFKDNPYLAAFVDPKFQTRSSSAHDLRHSEPLERFTGTNRQLSAEAPLDSCSLLFMSLVTFGLLDRGHQALLSENGSPTNMPINGYLRSIEGTSHATVVSIDSLDSGVGADALERSRRS